jgi:rfaE bifunctional protein nucleotidyltransferase chain/domain
MKVVWVNGCFDVLHLGHVRMLRFARSLGDHLIVGVNSDASVRALKGPSRPVFSATQRVEMLLELQCVNHVVVFDEPDPVDAIRRVGDVSIIVKGHEYADKNYLPECVLGLPMHFYDSGLSTRSSELIK